MSGTLSGGYVHHALDHGLRYWSTIIYEGQIAEYFPDEYKAIPLKGGIRTYTGKRLFFAGEVGASIAVNRPGIVKITDTNGTVERINDRAYNSFLYAVSAGYSFDNGWEAGVKFEDYASFNKKKQFNLRLAYRFKL